MRSQRGMRPGGAWGPSQATVCLLGLCWLAVVQIMGCASQPPASDAPASPSPAITDFWTFETPETVAVMVKSDRPLTHTAAKQEDPRGVLLRFPAAVLDGLESVYYPPPNPVIRSIRATETAGNDREAHVFLELSQDLPYNVYSEAEGLRITFQKPLAAIPVTGKSAAVKKKPKPAKAPAAAPATPAPSAPSTPAARVMRDVRTEAQADAVIIRVIADGPVKDVQAFTIDETPAKIVFDLIGLRSAYPGEQRMPVKSPWVSQVRHAGHPDKVRLVAETSKAHLNDFAMETVPDGLVITVGTSAAATRQNVGKGAAESTPKEKR